MKFIFTIITSLLFSFNSFAQLNLDSIKNELDNNHYKEAILVLTDFIKRDSSNSNSYNMLGCATIYQGFINDDQHNLEAIKYFSKAIEIDSTNSIFFHNRGWTYQNLNKYNLALKDYRKAMAIDFSNIEYHSNVLRCLWLQNKNKEAFEFANFTIANFPNDGYAYYVRGNLKRDYLHKYPEGNIDIKKSEELGWLQGFYLMY